MVSSWVLILKRPEPKLSRAQTRAWVFSCGSFSFPTHSATTVPSYSDLLSEMQWDDAMPFCCLYLTLWNTVAVLYVFVSFCGRGGCKLWSLRILKCGRRAGFSQWFSHHAPKNPKVSRRHFWDFKNNAIFVTQDTDSNCLQNILITHLKIFFIYWCLE